MGLSRALPQLQRITVAIDPHLGRIPARFDNRDADVVRDQLVGELFEHRLDREFCRRIVTRIGDDDAAKLTRHGEDMSLLARAHSGQHRAGKPVVAQHIGIEGELGRFHVLDLDRPGDADPGIVDQHIEPAADFALGAGDGIGHFVVEQYVEPHHADIERFVARQLHQLLGLGTRCLAHGGEDGCSGAGEMFGGEAPEAR